MGWSAITRVLFFFFKRSKPLYNSNNTTSAQVEPRTRNAGGAPSNRRILALNADVVDDILAATYASPSWKASQMEGTSWAGTGRKSGYWKRRQTWNGGICRRSGTCRHSIRSANTQLPSTSHTRYILHQKLDSPSKL